MTNLESVVKKVMSVSKKAGKELVNAQKQLENLTITSKKAQGVVSDADFMSEKIIIESLRKFYPEIPFLAEEEFFQKFKGKSESFEHFKKLPYVWLIDPLDGTSNYLNGLNYYAICIALLSFGKPILGLVYRPRTNEFYYGLKNIGAFYKKGSTIEKMFAATSKKKLKNSLMVTGFATEKGELLEQEFLIFRRVMENSRGVRRMGSAALDLCYVARGLFDGFWERGLAPWDVAAAGLICQEAGVMVTDYQGAVFSPFKNTILAARKPIHKKMIYLVKN